MTAVAMMTRRAVPTSPSSSGTIPAMKTHIIEDVTLHLAHADQLDTSDADLSRRIAGVGDLNG